jgi:uncharacterized protein
MSDDGPVAEFLKHRRLAFVGLSRNPADFSRHLFKDWKARGWDVLPVNPAATEVEGQPCYRRVQDISPPVEAAFVMTPPARTADVVRDCAQAGVRTVWMHRGAGQGAVSAEALELCRQEGMTVIPGACPYMFLPKAAGIHRLHGWVLGLVGKRPC